MNTTDGNTWLAILAIVPAVLIVMLAWRTAWRAAALLFGLALLSQAAALRLIVLTHYSIYQHFYSFGQITANAPAWALVMVVLQLAVVVYCAILKRREGVALLRSVSSRILLLVIAAGIGATSLAVPTVSVMRSAQDWVIAAVLSLTALANLALAANVAPQTELDAASSWLSSRVSLSDNISEPRPWDRWIPWLAAGFVLLVASTLCLKVLDALPHIDDSVSYLFQAKYFSAGHLTLPAPPDSAAFQMDEVIVDRGRWFGYAFPGWPAILAVGVAFGVPWLVNPLLGAVAVLLAHGVVRRIYGRGSANIVAVALACSPWLLVMSAEFMPHPASLVLALLAMLALLRERERPGKWSIVAGIALGVLFLTRPLDFILMAAAYGIWLLLDRQARIGWLSILRTVATAAITAALIFPYNAAVTGSATYAPHMMWTDRRWGPGVDRIGFGKDIGIPAWRNIDPLPGHGLPDVVLNLNKNLFAANWELFGWACGSLLLILAYIATGPRRRDSAMLAVFLTLVIGYSAYWFSGGPDLGPRYWYPAIVALIVISIRGASAVADRLQDRNGTSSAHERVALFAVAATISALLTVLPWRAADRYWHYRDVSGEVRRLAQENHIIKGALVFVRSPAREDYQSAFSLNPRTLHEDAPIYAWDKGVDSRARVVASYPARPVWVIGRNPASARQLTVISGPLQPGTVPP